MNLSVNDRIHNFTVTRVREEEFLSGRLVEMCHDETGTGLVWVDNGAENKTFSISFKTWPSDSTGVFHILEHSVLCGSKKYPVKEPFVELIKSSVNTFLNALTWPDKTMYPISSRSTRDFLNLTGVYLDAVFAPAILENELIFRQEGIRIDTDGEKPCFNGVVYNEMKGAMSSPDRVIGEKLDSMLFPDTSYGFNSGGAPEAIPDLTYEKFRETYLRFYHPSNALIFLDGDVPLEQTLELIDSYLSGKGRLTDFPGLKLQTPVAARDTNYYELSSEEDERDLGQLSLGRIFCSWKEIEKQMAARVIMEVIGGSNDAPLKRAVLNSGLAKELLLDIDDGVAQPCAYLTLKNLKDGCADEALELVRSEVRSIAARGLDKHSLHSALNRMEFSIKDTEEPQGLERCINCLRSWNFGGDPMMYLTPDKVLPTVRRMIDEGGMEELLLDMFADEEGTAVLLSLPSKELGAQKAADEEARLAKKLAGLTPEQLKLNGEMNEKLRIWQETPDSPEQLASLPLLSIEEISEPPRPVPLEASELNGVKVYTSNIPTNGIANADIYFPLTDFTLDELEKLAICDSLFSFLPTDKYDVPGLQNEINGITGKLSFRLATIGKTEELGLAKPCFAVCVSALREKFEAALELTAHILLETRFEPELIKELVLQENERCRDVPATSGHRLGIAATLSRYSASGALKEVLSGKTQLDRIKALAADFGGLSPELIELLEKLKKAFCRSRMIIGISSDAPVDSTAFINRFPEGTSVPEFAGYSISLPEKIGIKAPGAVSYAQQGWNLYAAGLKTHGSMRIVANMLSYAYLWNEVRVKGGAYGTGIGVRREGDLFTYSYRDPSPAASLQANLGMADFLRSFAESGEELEKYIISGIAANEPLLSSREKVSGAVINKLCGYTREMYLADRAEMLSTSKDSLFSFADVLDRFCLEGAVCVVGPADALDGVGGLERTE